MIWLARERYLPWRQRLASEGNLDLWPTIRIAVVPAYEQRAREFPDQAAVIRARAAQLPEDAP